MMHIPLEYMIFGLALGIFIFSIISNLPSRNDGAHKARYTEDEENERKIYAKEKPIIREIYRLSNELRRQYYERDPKESLNVRLKSWEIGGLFAAAGVGLFAIVVANEDASEQRSAMEEQLNAMVADQRPWLKISATPRSLRYDQTSGSANFQYAMRIDNVGRSVAIEARIESKVVTIPSNKNVFDIISHIQEDFCAETIDSKVTENMDKMHDGITLPPANTFHLRIRISGDRLNCNIPTLSILHRSLTVRLSDLSDPIFPRS